MSTNNINYEEEYQEYETGSLNQPFSSNYSNQNSTKNLDSYSTASAPETNKNQAYQDFKNSASAYWSSFSTKFNDIKKKTKVKGTEFTNYAKVKGSEFAVYANHQGHNLMNQSRNIVNQGRNMVMSKMKKEQPAEQTPQQEKEHYVFGMPLEFVMTYSGHEYGIPQIVYQCINEITYSIDEVGLYRIPGSSHDVEVLKEKFDALEPVDLSNENPNTVATLLKLYLRQLPNKLIDEESNNKINDIIKSTGAENPEDFTAFDEVAAILEEIPPWEYNLIGYICFHLKSVADNQDTNKMSVNNLGLIFCPTLKISPSVFSVLVVHSQNVFRRFLSDEDGNDLEQSRKNSQSSNNNNDENTNANEAENQQNENNES